MTTETITFQKSKTIVKCCFVAVLIAFAIYISGEVSWDQMLNLFK